MALHNKIGKIGEDIAAKWLKTKGHRILERNYRENWGEVDIISEKESGLHFVEVKTVSYETSEFMEKGVSHGTWRPEEKVSPDKLARIRRAIDSWLGLRKFDGKFQIDVLAVRLVPREKLARVEFIENIIIE